MRVVQCHELTGPSALRFAEIDQPEPGPGEVRLKVEAAGINFADSLMSVGRYQEKPELPFVVGLEAAGVIDALGPGVTGMPTGQRVMALLDHGGIADYAIAKIHDVFPLPEHMPFAESAGMAITYGTAVAALDWRARLSAGENVLGHGAGGGAGAAAVACARAMGAKVTATARGADKLEVARRHGAHCLIDSSDPDLVGSLKAQIPERFDVVFDPVGGAAFTASMKTLAWDGRIIVIGFASGTVPQIPANHVLVKNIAVLGLYWGSYRKHAPEQIADGFSKLFAWIDEGKLAMPRVTKADFSSAIEAIVDISERRTVGKTVITFS